MRKVAYNRTGTMSRLLTPTLLSGCVGITAANDGSRPCDLRPAARPDCRRITGLRQPRGLSSG